MGAEWQRLPAAVRRAHLRSDELDAKGVFYVTHGRRLLARLFIRMLRLPRSGSVPVDLHVTREGPSERWVRRFGEQCIVTVQRATRDGLLADYFRPLEFQFQLQILPKAIEYVQQRVAMRVGKFEFPLPGWLAPRVCATEGAIGNDRTYVHVLVTLPLVGRLMEYEGELMVEDRSP